MVIPLPAVSIRPLPTNYALSWRPYFLVFTHSLLLCAFIQSFFFLNLLQGFVLFILGSVGIFCLREKSIDMPALMNFAFMCLTNGSCDMIFLIDRIIHMRIPLFIGWWQNVDIYNKYLTDLDLREARMKATDLYEKQIKLLTAAARKAADEAALKIQSKGGSALEQEKAARTAADEVITVTGGDSGINPQTDVIVDPSRITVKPVKLPHGTILNVIHLIVLIGPVAQLCVAMVSYWIWRKNVESERQRIDGVLGEADVRVNNQNRNAIQDSSSSSADGGFNDVEAAQGQNQNTSLLNPHNMNQSAMSQEMGNHASANDEDEYQPGPDTRGGSGYGSVHGRGGNNNSNTGTNGNGSNLRNYASETQFRPFEGRSRALGDDEDLI